MSQSFENNLTGRKEFERSIDMLVDDVRQLLEDAPFESREEKEYYLHKLYGALSISNSPQVRELIHDIEERYGS